MSKYEQGTFVPAIPEIVPPPEPQPEVQSVRKDVSADSAWFVLTLANTTVAVVIIAGMLIDGNTTGKAILFGALYFFPTMSVFVLALTGTITDVIRSAQRQKTERQRIDTWGDLAEQALRWRQSVEDNRRLELERDNLPITLSKRLNEIDAKLDEVYYPPRAGGVQPPPDVAPYDNRGRAAHARELHPVDTTREEAIAWARKLYNDLGEPHPHYVQLSGRAIGRVQNTDIIGSARGKGSDEARLWLLQHRVLLKRPGGYALNLDLVPTERDLRYIE